MVGLLAVSRLQNPGVVGLMLSGRQIVEAGIVTPQSEDAVQPASVDLRLGMDRPLRLIAGTYGLGITPARYEPVASSIWALEPGDFRLVATAERVKVPPEYVGRVEGKSSMARMGLIVHTTAGFIDPGFEGYVTLELANVGPARLILTPHMYICQLSVHRMERVDGVYAGKYQGAKGVEGAKLV